MGWFCVIRVKIGGRGRERRNLCTEVHSKSGIDFLTNRVFFTVAPSNKTVDSKREINLRGL